MLMVGSRRKRGQRERRGRSKDGSVAGTVATSAFALAYRANIVVFV